MSALEIVPGLQVDSEMYELAAAGVASHAPAGVTLSCEEFVTPTRWMLIPDDRGELSKAEITLRNSIESTARLNVWFRSDLRRRRDRQMPHSHPWLTFTGHVLAGGYSENRFRLTEGGKIALSEFEVEHRSPAANEVDHDTFHIVSDVHEPGRTISLMVCGRGQRGDWGYLDVEGTGEYLHHTTQPVEGFDAMFDALNPHLR